MVKLWGGYGKRAANRSGRAVRGEAATADKKGRAESIDGRDAGRENAAADRFLWSADIEGQGAATASKVGAKPMQHNIIDFETLMSWYNEQSAGEALAVGDEWSDAHNIAQKRANLKFMLL